MQSDVIDKYRCLANGTVDGHTYSLSKEEWEEFQRITQKCKEYGRTVEEYLDAVEEFQKIGNDNREQLLELSKYEDTPVDLDMESATEILIRTMKQYELDNNSSCEIIDKLNMIPNS